MNGVSAERSPVPSSDFGLIVVSVGASVVAALALQSTPVAGWVAALFSLPAAFLARHDRPGRWATMLATWALTVLWIALGIAQLVT